jgi:hypothetical protein
MKISNRKGNKEEEIVSGGEVFFCLFFFFGSGIEPRASCKLGTHCTTELLPSPRNGLRSLTERQFRQLS